MHFVHLLFSFFSVLVLAYLSMHCAFEFCLFSGRISVWHICFLFYQTLFILLISRFLPTCTCVHYIVGFWSVFVSCFRWLLSVLSCGRRKGRCIRFFYPRKAKVITIQAITQMENNVFKVCFVSWESYLYLYIWAWYNNVTNHPIQSKIKYKSIML